VLARAGIVSSLFFPAPSVIGATLLRLFQSGVMVKNLSATLQRLAVGFVAGAVPALLLGLAMGRSRRLRRAVDPLVASIHPMPKIAILPLFIIVFGIGEASKVVLISLGAFFPILINAMAGVRQISPIHFEVAQNYGAGRWKVLSRVLLPGSMPMVLAGVRLGVNIALLLTIALEIVAADTGLGATVWLAWETLRTEEIYATLVVIAGIGVGLNLVLYGGGPASAVAGA
jgi:NitT/TauT family transport system permease protein